MLLLACLLFAEGFDQCPPRQARLDDVLVVLGEAGGGVGFHVGIGNRKARVLACVVHHH